MGRILGADRQRERAAQQAIQERLEIVSTRLLVSEIRRAGRDASQSYSNTGKIGRLPGHDKRVFRILRAIYSTAIPEFGSRILAAVKSTGPDEQKAQGRALWERLISEYLNTRGGQKIADDIAQTTKDQIARIVLRGQKEGMGTDAIGKLIRANVDGLSTLRANTIARTETHGSANFGALETAKETGLPMTKEWISARDDRTRDGSESDFDHVSADGQTVPMDQPFDVSGEQLMYPGDASGSAGNIINCRCASGFVIED